MKRIKNMIFAVLILALTAGIFAGCGPKNVTTTPTVMDIEVETAPKTEYTVGETLDIKNGVLKLFYTDDTTGTLAFDAEGVTIGAPDMSTAGKKTVSVEYDGFATSYQITVKERNYKVTFDFNCSDEYDPIVKSAESGETVDRPETPTREGFRFDGWFTKAQDGELFDFTDPVTSDLILFAGWTQLFKVTFDLNYQTAPNPSIVEVADGSAVLQTSAPSTTGNTGFLFRGWHTHPLDAAPYDFGSAVTEPLTLYAHWAAVGENDKVFDVTFDYNYENAPASVVRQVLDGETAEEPSPAPGRYGYIFSGWHTHAENDSPYSFSSGVTGSITLYAHWTVDFYVIDYKYVLAGKEYEYNKKEVSPNTFVASDAVRMPVVSGYYFTNGCWYTDSAYTELFDFDNTRIKRNYTLYAKPLKVNKFEAEHSYIDDQKAGQGFSNNLTGIQMIDRDNGSAGASNGYWVGNMFYNGAFLEFVVESDKTVTDAVLGFRLSAEWRDMYLAPETKTVNGREYYGYVVTSAKAVLDDNDRPLKDTLGYVVYENAIAYDYEPIALEGAIDFGSSDDKRPFSDHLITTSLKLYEGVNVIRLTVNNTKSWDGTMDAAAPMVDCIYINTDAAITWTPHTDNIDRWLEQNQK